MTSSEIGRILEEAPDNWGNWGDADELGAANYLTSKEVLRGITTVESGTVIPLGHPIGNPGGDPTWPVPHRSQPQKYMVTDKGHIEAGKLDRAPFGGFEAANDVIHMSTHGTTHVDALGHVWYDDKLYNGFDANSTKGGLDRCGVEHLGHHGLVGKGILLDIARHRGVDHLPPRARITLEELQACAAEQGLSLDGREIVLLRTGVLEVFYESGPDAFYETYSDDGMLNEPGITYSQPLVDWFDEQEIPVFGTDTLGSEQTVSDETETLLPTHPALIRDLGIVISEMNDLSALAEACLERDSYEFCYMCAPMPIVGGTGSPVNPLAIL